MPCEGVSTNPALAVFARALLIACGCLAALGAGPAFAGQVSRGDGAGDVAVKGLSRSERRALDIVSVRVVGDESSGLFVTVRFKGDVERFLGQGHLKRALVALVLRPKSSAQSPAGLVTRGGGFSRKRVALPRRTRRGIRVRRTLIKRFGRERVLRKTSSEQVGAIRRKNQILFYITGPGLSNVGSIQVKAYASLAGVARRAAAAKAPPKVPEVDWKKILDDNRDPADLAEAGVDTSELSCDQLKALRASFIGTRAFAEKLLERDDATLQSLKGAVEHYSTDEYHRAKALGQPYATKAELQHSVDFYLQVVKREKAMITIASRLIKQVDGIIRDRCSPPPAGANKPPVITSFGAVFGTQCSTCTLYTVSANDPEGQALSYSWSKSPPPGGNPGATNCGTFTENSPAANQAIWDHPNGGASSCSHAAGEHPGYIAVVVTDAQGGQTLFTDTHGSANYTSP